MVVFKDGEGDIEFLEVRWGLWMRVFSAFSQDPNLEKLPSELVMVMGILQPEVLWPMRPQV